MPKKTLTRVAVPRVLAMKARLWQYEHRSSRSKFRKNNECGICWSSKAFRFTKA